MPVLAVRLVVQKPAAVVVMMVVKLDVEQFAVIVLARQKEVAEVVEVDVLKVVLQIALVAVVVVMVALDVQMVVL